MSYEADLDEVKRLAIEAAKRSKHYSGHEDPEFWVMEMDKSGIRCWIAAWADTPSAGWMLGHDIRSELAMEFRRRGIWTHRHHHRLSPAADLPQALAGLAPPG